jgi:hypothetical protein
MSTTATQSTRTDRGRFARGNPGGPGRPRRQTEAAYLRVMMDACPLDAWEEVVRSAVDAAKAGDHQARQWLTRYLVGEAEATAPRPTAVIIEELLGRDGPMDAAAAQKAKAILDRRKYPALHKDDGEEERVIAQVKAELLAAEEERRRQGETAGKAA